MDRSAAWKAAALAAQFRAWAGLPLARIVVSHGEPVANDPAGVLREVAATLDWCKLLSVGIMNKAVMARECGPPR
jgi:hypothetical protein